MTETELRHHVVTRIARVGRAPTSEDLAAILTTAPDLDALAARARFSAAGVERIPIVRTDHVHLSLLGWRPGARSGLHDHGGAESAFAVLAGSAEELRVDGPVRTHHRGDVVAVPAGVLHQVTNTTPLALVTVHLDSPPRRVADAQEPSSRTIAILGGGWTGTVLAVHLLAAAGPHVDIVVVEPDPRLGRGVAFGTGTSEHLLNVPAARMSLDPAQPDDFIDYLRTRGLPADPQELAPRTHYGDYVVDRLRGALRAADARLHVIRDVAVRARPERDRWRIRLASGAEIAADDVVLATGHGPDRVPRALASLGRSPRLIARPTSPGALDRIGRDDRVLVVGTGLTAIDVLLSLRARRLRGPVHTVSRHGRWPRPHLPEVTWRGPALHLDVGSAPATADGLAAWFASRVADAAAHGVPWQAVVDAVRHDVPDLWNRLDDAERTAFLTRHRALWDVLRHRTPERTWRTLRAWRDDGWVVGHVGAIADVTVVEDGLEVLLPGRDEPERFDHVILATGPASDPRTFEAPLWIQLLRDGLVVADRHGLGVRTTRDAAVLGAGGETRGLWAAGGLRRPDCFEATAVPDLAPTLVALARGLARSATRQALTAATGVSP